MVSDHSEHSGEYSIYLDPTRPSIYDRREDCTFTTFIGYEYSGTPLSFNSSGIQ